MDTGQPDAAHQRRSCARCWSTRDTGKARGVAFVDAETRQDPTRRKAKVVVARRLDPRVGAPPAAVEVAPAPERHRQLERPRRPQLLRARDGARRRRPREGPRRQAAHPRRRPARRLLRPALPQPQGQAAGLHPRLRLRRRQRAPACIPDTRADTPGFGAAYKKAVRDYAGAFIEHGRRSARCCRATRTRSSSTPR